MVLIGLFALAAMGSASATQMKSVKVDSATAARSVTAQAPTVGNPWPDLASATHAKSGPMLAHDDRYRHDERWDDRRDDWRREQWRKEQWRREQYRREAERRRDWERRHRAMEHRYYDDDRRYYRR
ncbi:hypothetical protein D3C72_2165270 [compost metagenome]